LSLCVTRRADRRAYAAPLPRVDALVRALIAPCAAITAGFAASLRPVAPTLTSRSLLSSLWCFGWCPDIAAKPAASPTLTTPVALGEGGIGFNIGIDSHRCRRSAKDCRSR
jgi:hypothetical protein